MGFHLDALFFFLLLHYTKRFRDCWYLLCHFARSGLRVLVRVLVVGGKKNLSQDRSALICESLTGSIIASYCLRESGAYCARLESHCF